MKISDLPPGLRELAEERFKKQNGYMPTRLHHLAHFSWISTEEGWYLWLEANNGNFAPYYNCRVVNLKMKEK